MQVRLLADDTEKIAKVWVQRPNNYCVELMAEVEGEEFRIATINCETGDKLRLRTQVMSEAAQSYLACTTTGHPHVEKSW